MELIIKKRNGKTFTVLYDECDHELVFFFFLIVNGDSYPYLRCTINGKSVRMHNLIAKSKIGEVVDHINGNPLDNRRCNLRVCDHTQNMWNSKKGSNNKSGYKGVFINKGSKTFETRIVCRGKRHYIGTFETAEDAARAYNYMAIELFGEFAHTNNVYPKLPENFNFITATVSSKSGVRNISWCSQKKRWLCAFEHKKVLYFVGYFSCIEKAKVELAKKRSSVCVSSV